MYMEEQKTVTVGHAEHKVILSSKTCCAATSIPPDSSGYVYKFRDGCRLGYKKLIVQANDNYHTEEEEDRISVLPDDVLVGNIISKLNMKEAAATSILSHRWHKLWTFVHRITLDFDGSKVMDEVLDRRMQITAIVGPLLEDIPAERKIFITWVDGVLNNSRCIDGLQEFIVRFWMESHHSSQVDSWIRFAATQRLLERLVLNFSGIFLTLPTAQVRYKFPSWALHHGFDSLKDLELKYIDVTGEVLEQFLHHCKGLERLSVESSHSLVDLKAASGVPLKLKILEIIYCNNIKSVHISPVDNLESFTYMGRKLRSTPFKDFPPLSEAAFGGKFGLFVTNHFDQLSAYLACLETLTFNIGLDSYFPVRFPNFVVLGKLKHLEVQVMAAPDESLLCFTPMIEAAPLLHTFVLKVSWEKEAIDETPLQVGTAKCPHSSLKVVEIIGFEGCTRVVEIANYLLENALFLEKIVLDPHPVCLWENEDIEKCEAARHRARQLGAKLPPGAKLVVL